MDKAIKECVEQILYSHLGEYREFSLREISDHNVWQVQAESFSAYVKQTRQVSIYKFLADGGVVPRILGYNEQHKLILLEDVGLDTVDQLLLGADPEAATAGLVDMAASMAKLHGWSSQHNPPTIRQDFLPTNISLTAILNVTGALEINSAAALVEFQELFVWRESESGFRTIVHGDPCPENFATRKEGGCFIDLDNAFTAPSFIDAVFWRIPFPTGWQVARVPSNTIAQIENAYRVQLCQHIRAAQDDRKYYDGIASGCAWWLGFLVGGKRLIEEPIDHELHPELATVRQRTLLWFDQITNTLEELSRYPAIALLARDMGKALSKRWGGLEKAPLFPAFRGSSK